MNSKKTKGALFSSVIALVLCFTMLLGTTFAWFTDEVTSANNIIKSGNLDIELEYSKDMTDGSWKTVKGSDEVINKEALWEPGYTEVVYLKLSNLGTLALKYSFSINFEDTVIGKTEDDKDIKLSEHLKYAVVDVTAKYADRDAARDAVKDVAVPLAGYAVSGEMQAGDDAKTVALVIYMPEEVGNEANYRGEKVPQIVMGIDLFATQLTAEYDSFGNDYDAMAGGNYHIQYSFSDPADLLAFAPTEGDAASSGLSINSDGEAQIDSNGAWYTIDADLTTGEYVVEYDLDITDLSDGENVTVDTGESVNWGSTPIMMERGSTKVYYGLAKNEYLGELEGTVVHVTHVYSYNSNNKLEITTTVSDGDASVSYTKAVASAAKTTLYWDIYFATESGKATMDNFSVKETNIIVDDAEELQDALDRAVTGMTIELAPGVNYGTVAINPTASNETTMYCETHNFTTDNAETFKAHLAESGYHTTPRYTTTLKDVTIVGASGAVIEGLTASSGHVVGPAYDHVRGIEYTEGSAYYYTLNISNLKFDNVDFAGQVNFGTSDADSVFDGVTFEGCTFTTGGTASTNGAAIRYYNESNNGNVKNIVVNNCSFTNCYQGVYVHHVNGITVTDSTFNTTGHNAIAIQCHGGEYGAVDLKNVVITGNTFKNIGNRVIRFNEIGADSSITIKNNVATNSGDEDGEVMKATSIAEGVTTSISGNTWSGTVYNDELKGKDDVTVVSASTQDALNDAVTASGAVVDVTLAAGTYTIPDSAKGKTLTIIGTGETTVSVVDDGGSEGDIDYSLEGSTVTFEGVTLNIKGSNYPGYARMSATYNNCTITGSNYCLYGDSVFNNCTFNLNNGYVWTWGAGKVEFNNCTFEATDGSAKAILVHNTVETVVTVNNCKFIATTAKTTWDGIPVAAVSIDPENGSPDATVYFVGTNTYSDAFHGLYQVKYADETDDVKVYVDGTLVENVPVGENDK